MMSVPLGLAVGLSVVALVWPEPDGSAGGVEEDTPAEGSATDAAENLARELG
jgi:hypothetical protein